MNKSYLSNLTNLMHKIVFYTKFIIRPYMFRALCAHHYKIKIVLYSIWYHHTCRWPSGALVGSGLQSALNLCSRQTWLPYILVIISSKFH